MERKASPTVRDQQASNGFNLTSGSRDRLKTDFINTSTDRSSNPYLSSSSRFRVPSHLMNKYQYLSVIQGSL